MPSMQTQLSDVVPQGTVSWVCEYLSDASRPAVEVVVEEEATLLYVLFQNLPADAAVKASRVIRLKQGASATVIVASVGGATVQLDVRTVLEGADAVGNISVLAYGRGSERQELTARTVCAARNGGGEILMRAVAEGKAEIRCDGMIDIGLKGGGTDTYLTQEVLMLDPTARVDAIPGLEIKTNDVKASHSATVSRVTEEDLFYFGSRSIPQREARRMFVEGFLGEIADTIPDDGARKAVVEAVGAKYDA